MGRSGSGEGRGERPVGQGPIHVVLGARGGIGGAIVRELVGQGRRVRAVTRNGDAGVSKTPLPPASYEDVAADILDPARMRRALVGAAVVYHCARPTYTHWWREFPVLNRAVIDAVAEAGAKLVYADNLSMYEPRASPLTELTPATAATKKGSLRGTLAAELLAEHESGRLRVTIGRASDYFGPGGLHAAAGRRFFTTLLAGGKVQWFASLDQPHTMCYLPDLARAFIVLATHPGADGQVWHLPAAPAVTGRQFIEAASQAAGVPPRPAVLREATATFFGLFVPILREYPELAYQWNAPFVSDASKFEEGFGPFAVTRLDEALAATVAWFRAHA